MSSASVGSFRSELEAVRESLRESHLNALRNTLRDSDILGACREVLRTTRAEWRQTHAAA